MALVYSIVAPIIRSAIRYWPFWPKIFGASLNKPWATLAWLHCTCACACLLACLDRPLTVCHFGSSFTHFVSCVNSKRTPGVEDMNPCISPRMNPWTVHLLNVDNNDRVHSWTYTYSVARAIEVPAWQSVSVVTSRFILKNTSWAWMTNLARMWATVPVTAWNLKHQQAQRLKKLPAHQFVSAWKHRSVFVVYDR